MATQTVIQDFLDQRNLALVGVSRDRHAFANTVFRALVERGYVVHPVNPNAVELEGVKAYANVRHVPDPLDGVIIMVGAGAVLSVIDDCIYRGVQRVWLHRGVGQGSVPEGAVETCVAQGISVVDGACPLMFLDHPGLLHTVHRIVSGRHVAA